MANRDLSAYKGQHDSIREEFKKQAVSWGRNEVSPHLRWVVDHLDLRPQFEVLDVAAGTGLLSRAISPHVKRVVALDITPEMLTLSPSALKKVVEDSGVQIINYYSREVENSADEWLDFTRTEASKRQQIVELMQRDLDGVSESGMRPFFKENKLMFMHTWGIIVGEKR